MPNSTLPTNNYLGDPQRTTSEFQTAINQLQNWVNTLQAELNALSATTVKEGAVRSVGTGASDLVQTSQLNTRLGTSGNLDLGTASEKDFGTNDGNLPEYQEQIVELGGQFNAGERVKCVRIGNVVFISGFEGPLSHSSGSAASSAVDAIPSWARPAGSFSQANVYHDSGSMIQTVQVSPTGVLSTTYVDSTTGIGIDRINSNFSPTLSFTV